MFIQCYSICITVIAFFLDKMISLENVRRLWFINSTRTANYTMDGDTNCSGQVLKPNTIWEVVLTKSFQISIVKVTVPGM